MNELFTLPATAPSRLHTARKRYEAADTELERVLGASDWLKYPMAEHEYLKAEAELAAAERERMTP